MNAKMKTFTGIFGILLILFFASGVQAQTAETAVFFASPRIGYLANRTTIPAYITTRSQTRLSLLYKISAFSPAGLEQAAWVTDGAMKIKPITK